MRFSGRHHARATSQQSMWPLEKYCPKLILNHQSWVTQWSQIQHLRLNIVFLFYSKDDHWARYPWPLCIYGGLREISFYTSDLHHPWSLTPGPPPLVPHWGHPAPVTAPRQQRQLFHQPTAAQEGGGGESGQGKWEWNEEPWEDELGAGEGRREETSSPLCAAQHGSSGLFSAFFILWACQGQSPACSCTH